MQTFTPSLRIAQSVANLTGADDSLQAINTNIISPGAIVLVRSFHRLYELQKDSTAAALSPNIIAPAQGGPGRWVSLGAGANYFQSVTVVVPAIPPQSFVPASALVTGATGPTTQVVVYNLLDSGISSLVVNPRITGLNTVAWDFANITSATVASANITLEVAVLG